MRFQEPSHINSELFLKYLKANSTARKLKVLLLSDDSLTYIGKVVTLNSSQFESCDYEYCIIFNESLFGKLPLVCRRILVKQLVLALESQYERQSKIGCNNDLWRIFLKDKSFFKDMARLDKYMSSVV